MITIECVGGPRDGEVHTVPDPHSVDAWLDVTDDTRDPRSAKTAAVTAGARYKLRMFAAYGAVRPSINMYGNYRAQFDGWQA